MTTPRRPRRTSFADLILTFGLAAFITSVSGSLNDALKGGRERHGQQCLLAAQVLQDDQPASYLDTVARQRMGALALRRFDRCMRE